LNAKKFEYKEETNREEKGRRRLQFVGKCKVDVERFA
jgi:hypothetical protein